MSSRRSHYRHVFLLLLTFAWAGCGGGDGGRGSPFGPLPNETPDADIFGIVELTGVIVSTNCEELLREAIGSTTMEQYRVYATQNGCAISEHAEDGTSLENNEGLFDDEDTTCSAGGNVVRLEAQRTLLGDGTSACVPTENIIAQYTVDTVEKTVSGSYRTTLSVSGQCNETQLKYNGCALDATLSGVFVSYIPRPDQNPVGPGEGEGDGGGDEGPLAPPAPGPGNEPAPIGTTGLMLNLRIPDYTGGVGTSCGMIFELCDPSERCYRTEINREGNDLERGGYYEFLFSQDDALEGADSLASFYYPEDFSSFSIELASDCSNEDGGKVFIGGVELRMRDSGEPDFRSVYRSPCVDRWLDPMTAWNRTSFSFSDDAWCFTIGTSTIADARTNDDHVYVDLPLSYPLTLASDDWLHVYQADSTHVPTYSGEDYLGVLLNHVSYDDWTEGARDSYGFTFDSGGYGMPGVRLRINGGNRWTVDEFLAVSYRPGDANFLDYQDCRRLVLNDLNANLDGDNPSMASALPGSMSYYTLEPAPDGECADLSTIQCTASTTNFCVGE